MCEIEHGAIQRDEGIGDGMVEAARRREKGHASREENMRVDHRREGQTRGLGEERSEGKRIAGEAARNEYDEQEQKEHE